MPWGDKLANFALTSLFVQQNLCSDRCGGVGPGRAEAT